MNNHYNKNLKKYARELRNNMTRAEKRIWYELLCNRQVKGYKFLRQRPIDQYIVDFFCKELMLIIEIDGKSHFYEEAYFKDQKRQHKLESLGYHFIRFSDYEVLSRFADVQILLLEKIDKLSG